MSEDLKRVADSLRSAASWQDTQGMASHDRTEVAVHYIVADVLREVADKIEAGF